MLPSLHLLILVRLDVWRDAATSYANRKKLAIYRTTHAPLLRPPALNTDRLAALRRDCKLITPRVEEKKGRVSTFSIHGTCQESTYVPFLLSHKYF